MSADGDSSASSCPSPEARSDSRGSSVSAGLREEYEDLLRYAVVAPKLSLTVAARKIPPSTEHHTGNTESEEEQSTLSEPSQLPTPPLPSSPPPHPSSQAHLSQSPSPPPHPHPPMSHQPPHPPPSDVTHTSHDHSDDITGTRTDPELARLGAQLDSWCLELKRNVLAEFEQARLRLLESHQAELQRQLQQQAHAMQQVREELERYKELVATYEHSVARKDQLIASLNASVEKQRSRVQLQKSFSSWKIQHHDEQREVFTSALARRHYHHHLRSRVWKAWFGIIKGRWRDRVERACQTKAEEVCTQLTNEYEEQLAVAQRALDESRQEIQQIKADHNLYEEGMKKALMRGVCALNLEAMSMFRQHDAPAPGGNSFPQTNGERPLSEEEQDETNSGSDPSLVPSHLSGHPPPPSHPPPSQLVPPHPSGHPLPPSHPPPSHFTHPQLHHPPKTVRVAASSAQVQPPQPRSKSTTARGQSSVGVANRRCGRVRPGPAVMVERHTVGEQ